jgi:hypothetical protein
MTFVTMVAQTARASQSGTERPGQLLPVSCDGRSAATGAARWIADAGRRRRKAREMEGYGYGKGAR